MSNVEVESVFGSVGERMDDYERIGVTEETERAHSGVPYKAPPSRPDTLCTGNDNTCGARKANGTEFCVGHLRSRGEL